jgi:ABC-type polysaccharide/polyol phosphate transport system ATPase subunit
MINQDTAIYLENASVKYLSPMEAYWSFKEFFIRFLQHRVKMQDFWALKEINLEIKNGETFGVIGRNGAGKSTLVKLISRILSPTSGRVVTRGVISPLLELGAGFHPELTGRENIFLNGTLLGHSQREIKAHFDEILGFAQVDGYIDAPLRTYSSGMVARLGFAVATTWKPEILVLDEILAVGDEEFRTKCYARIKQFHSDGTTIILVSHDLNSIIKYCSRAVWLDQGAIQKLGNAEEVVSSYRSMMD